MNIIYFPHKLGQKKNGVQNSYKLFNNIGKIVNCKNEGNNLLYNRNDIKFIHNNGHFAGSKSLEGAVFLCEKSLL